MPHNSMTYWCTVAGSPTTSGPLNVGSLREYQAIRESLERPVPIVIDPLESSCDPPDDPDWPAPATDGELRDLINRLPPWAYAICAVTAVEMILQNWEDDPFVSSLPPLYRNAPQKAVQRVWDWVAGDATENQVYYAAERSRGAATRIGNLYLEQENLDFNSAWQASRPASAAADAAYAITDIRSYYDYRPSRAISAVTVSFAVVGSPLTQPHETLLDERFAVLRAQIYAEWWRQCRCRLAVVLGE